MNYFLKRLDSPTAFLYAYVITTQIAVGIYEAAQLEPHPALTAVAPFGFLWALACWFQRDLRLRGFRWAIDVGFFLYVGGLVLLPYYLFKTRGARAMPVMLWFVLIYIGSLALGISLYVFFGPFAE